MADELKLGPMFSGEQPTMGLQPNNGGLPAAIGNFLDYAEYAKKKSTEAEAEKQVSVQTNSRTGMASVELPQHLLTSYLEKVKAQDQIQDIYFQKLMAQNQARMQALQAHPWQNTLATIAGSLAANDPNPITRGLGQAAQKLNPSLEQLQGQQLQLMQGQGQVQGRSLEAISRIASLEEQKRYREATAGARKEEVSTKSHDAQLKLAQDAAKKGIEISADAFPALNEKEIAAIQGLGAKATELKAQEFQKGIEKLKALEDIKTAGAHNRDQYRHGLRQAEIAQRVDASFARLDKQQEYKEAMKDYSESLAQDRELWKVPSTEKKRLIDLRSIEKYTGEVRQLLASPEMKGYVGPLQPERILPRFAQSPDRAKVEEFLAQELPRINSAIKGGVRMVSSPEGRKFIQDNLGFKSNLPAESILKILDNVDTIVSNEREGVIEAYPAAWKKYPELLGASYDYAKSIGSGGQAQPMGLKGASAPAPKGQSKTPAAPKKKGDKIDLGGGVTAERID